MTPPTMTYDVMHSTRYTYESEVSASYGQLHLLPRDLPGQVCSAFDGTDRPYAFRLPGARRLLRQPCRVLLCP